MAFQNTAGTIIIDAVLTDLGRKRMVQGNFKVTKFALGDDEINYALRSPSKDSFSVHAGLKNTPLFEAFAAENAAINYGLVSYPRTDVYYVPELVINTTGIAESATPYPSKKSGVYYISVNSETTTKLKSVMGTEGVLESDELTKTKLLIESGINNATDGELPCDKIAKERFLLNMNLYDQYFMIYCDSRFIENVLSSHMDSYIKDDKSYSLYMNFEPLKRNIKISLASIVDKFDAYKVEGVDNRMYGAIDSTKSRPGSVLKGPRGTIAALNFNILNELRGDSQSTAGDNYYIFGKRSQTLFGGTDKYDYIDTTIYIEGMASNASLRVPLRIIRYAGT
tara:strand:+ start:8851 stop:9864 length:1014 start_codon:yes stop_codon:yes gene_type:complete